MAELSRQWLTTGAVARLCSVKPDTVQKWIRKGRLEAQRTAGGHYRIALADVEPYLTKPMDARWYCAPPAGCQPQPLRCWEYLAEGGATREECRKCVVYRVRAAWCFEVLGMGAGNGHSRQFCHSQSSCLDCLYYKRVCRAPLVVLAVTADCTLASQLQREQDESLLIHLASNAYQAAVVIGDLRPAFVIVDEELCRAEPRLLQDLTGDSRVPGLRVALCGPSEESSGRTLLPRLPKPFGMEHVRRLVTEFPVEHHLPE